MKGTLFSDLKDAGAYTLHSEVALSFDAVAVAFTVLLDMHIKEIIRP